MSVSDGGYTPTPDAHEWTKPIFVRRISTNVDLCEVPLLEARPGDHVVLGAYLNSGVGGPVCDLSQFAAADLGLDGVDPASRKEPTNG